MRRSRPTALAIHVRAVVAVLAGVAVGPASLGACLEVDDLGTLTILPPKGPPPARRDVAATPQPAPSTVTLERDDDGVCACTDAACVDDYLERTFGCGFCVTIRCGDARVGGCTGSCDQ